MRYKLRIKSTDEQIEFESIDSMRVVVNQHSFSNLDLAVWESGRWDDLPPVALQAILAG